MKSGLVIDEFQRTVEIIIKKYSRIKQIIEMGNRQVLCVCSDCSPIQIESERDIYQERMTFQMTKIREFSHYSRDFQVEQKFNRIQQTRPNYQLQVQIVYSCRNQHLRDQLILKSGINSSQRLLDITSDTINKSFRVGNFKLDCSIKSLTVENLSGDSANSDLSCLQMIACADIFLVLFDDKDDFALYDLAIKLIIPNQKCESIIFLLTPQKNTSNSFVINHNPINYQEQKNYYNSLPQPNVSDFQDNTYYPEEHSSKLKMQNWVKSIIDSHWNIDSLTIDFQSPEKMNAQLETIFSSSIYSQDKFMRQVM